MALAVLRCVSDCLFQKKVLRLDEDIPVRLGRAHKHEKHQINNGVIPLEKPYISYKHAVITWYQEKVVLTDLSTNGTYVNNQKLIKNKPFELNSGDLIQLGFHSLKETNTSVLLSIKIFLQGDEDEFYLDKLDDIGVFELYNEDPKCYYNLENLYQILLERFEVLQILNHFGKLELTRKLNIAPILDKIKSNGFINILNLINRTFLTPETEFRLLEANKVSHFVLKIACCRTFPLRRWFLEEEAKLMFIKWCFLKDYEKMALLKSSFPEYVRISPQEKTSLTSFNEFLDLKMDYFKVSFLDASTLLRNRVAVSCHGYVYATAYDMITPILRKVENNMYTSLMALKRGLHRILDEDRIISVINYVEKNIKFNKYSLSLNEKSIKPQEVEKLSAQSFPLCMNILQYYLTKNHHLRNGGRFQYSLFLKGIGLDLQNALQFWRCHFTQKIDVTTFMKEYSYHICHVYGAVGKMADYPPQNCFEILKANPGPLDYHGCPYKILNKNNLMYNLRRNQISKDDADEICGIAEKGMPQIACSKYFEVTHGTDIGLVEHPNKYYQASQQIKIARAGSQNGEKDTKVCCLDLKRKNLEW